jgi:predicted amidohydrolase
MLITIAAIRISLIQMSSRTAARDENVQRACGFITTAAAEGDELAAIRHGQLSLATMLQI